jgi:hypothetical protein
MILNTKYNELGLHLSNIRLVLVEPSAHRTFAGSLTREADAQTKLVSQAMASCTAGISTLKDKR